MDFSHYTSNRSQLTVIKALRPRLPALNLDPGFGGFYWWTSVALLRCTYQGKWSFRICWFPQFSGRFWGRWWNFISITWCHDCFLFFWNNNSLLHLKQTDKFALFPATNTWVPLASKPSCLLVNMNMFALQSELQECALKLMSKPVEFLQIFYLGN